MSKGYTGGVGLRLFPLLLLGPFQHLVEFALVGWRGREQGTVFFQVFCGDSVACVATFSQREMIITLFRGQFYTEDFPTLRRVIQKK